MGGRAHLRENRRHGIAILSVAVMAIVFSGHRWLYRRGLRLVSVAALIFQVPYFSHAGASFDPAMDLYSICVGTETFHAMYKFPTNTTLSL
jgi:hypothetical protein